MRASVIKTVAMASLGLSVTSCRISEPTPRLELDPPAERAGQETYEERAASETSVVESSGVASSDMLDSGVEEITACDGDLCDQRCETDDDCQHLGEGLYVFYCDQEEGYCVDGCYEGSCFGDTVCDLESRLCTDRPCISNADCDSGQYCDPESLICLTV